VPEVPDAIRVASEKPLKRSAVQGNLSARAEVFTVYLKGDQLEAVGPIPRRPWIVPLDRDRHPTESVRLAIAEKIGMPWVVHSTSWRHDECQIVLTYMAVVDEGLVDREVRWQIVRSSIAGSDAASPTFPIAAAQVVEHGLRHLAWLSIHDSAVSSALPKEWHRALEVYAPDRFRNLG
jgi:hypothetical protein